MKKIASLLFLILFLLSGYAEEKYPERISMENGCFLAYDGSEGLYELRDSSGNLLGERYEYYCEYDAIHDIYLITDGIYDFISPSEEFIPGFVRDGTFGYVTGEGEWLFELEFDYAEPFDDNGLAFVKKNGLYGVIKTDGSYLFEPLFSDRWGGFQANGLAAIKQNEYWGYIRADGTFFIEPQFDEEVMPDYGFMQFEKGVARVIKDGKYGYLLENGEYLFEPQFDYAFYFNDSGVAVVRNGALEGMVSVNGDFICPIVYNRIYDVSEEFAKIYNYVGGKILYGFFDIANKRMIEPRFDYIGDFSDEGLALVLDEDLDNGCGLYGYIGRDGEYMIKPIFESAHDFQEGLAAVSTDSEKWGYIGIDGKYVIEPQFDFAYGFRCGMAPVECHIQTEELDSWGCPYELEYYGLIDTQGRLLLPYEYDTITISEDGIVTAKKGEQYFKFILQNGELEEITVGSSGHT